MANYCGFHQSIIGYSHVLKGICCQDSSCSVSEEGIHIAVVSDGHGDPACFRSHIGSRLAADIAAEKLLSFAQNIRQQGWEDRLFDNGQKEDLLRQLIRSIIGNWNLKIAEQLEENPVTEEELAISGNYESRYRAGEELPHIFGCTLIALLITDRYLLALQQGDGRCTVVHGNGIADQPIPWDSRCVGNVCTSMCHADAIESCRYYVADLRKDPVLACFAVSDGIEDSLDSQEDVNAFACNTASIYFQQGREKLLEQLADYLPKMSQMGSADDMSIAGIVDMDAGESAMRWMELTYILSNHKAAQRNAAGKAGSMARKQDYLKEELDLAQQEFDRVQTEYNRVCQQMQQNLTLTERLKQELRKLLHAQDNQTVILEAAGKKLEKAREDYEDYVEKRLGFVEKAQEAEAEVLRTQQAIDALAAELFDQVPEQTQPEIPDWELAEPIAWEDEEPFSQEENEQEKLQPEEAPMPETEPEAADDFD